MIGICILIAVTRKDVQLKPALDEILFAQIGQEKFFLFIIMKIETVITTKTFL